MKNQSSNVSEQLFAALCSQFYLKGFVFHSPKYFDPTEKELGDVVLWVRTHLVVFEVVWRNIDAPGNTRHFVKRIGEKRDQLVKDFEVFGDSSYQVEMTNEAGEKLVYNSSQYFDKQGFCGVVIVDSDTQLTKLHYKTYKKFLEQDFPIAVFTKQDFLDLLTEIDTISDLRYYLLDRMKFIKKIFHDNAGIFLNLNNRIERNLIAFYKTFDNSFPLDKWDPDLANSYWNRYQHKFADRLTAREAENQQSFILDEIIDLLRSSNSPTDSTLLHSWELAVLPRRARAGILTQKVETAFRQMVGGRRERHFSFLNPVTGCWNLFFFQYGGDIEEFRRKAHQLTIMKMRVERVERNFSYSVFCFAFRKSFVVTQNTFDNVVLLVEDATKYMTISSQEYQEAKRFAAGITEKRKIQEFPSSE